MCGYLLVEKACGCNGHCNKGAEAIATHSLGRKVEAGYGTPGDEEEVREI